MIDQFQKLYNDEQMVDCTLSCSDGMIKAHKLVLSACSPYFTQLFINWTNPYQYPVIILKDMSFADLRVLIEFMYKGEVTVSQNLLPSVLESAKALQITGLREIKVGRCLCGMCCKVLHCVALCYIMLLHYVVPCALPTSSVPDLIPN